MTSINSFGTPSMLNNVQNKTDLMAYNPAIGGNSVQQKYVTPLELSEAIDYFNRNPGLDFYQPAGSNKTYTLAILDVDGESKQGNTHGIIAEINDPTGRYAPVAVTNPVQIDSNGQIRQRPEASIPFNLNPKTVY